MEQISNFRQTWLWRHAFVNPQVDITASEQEYFSNSFIRMREKAAILVSQISSAIPGLTVHDISHLDALWEMASLISEGAITVTPAEAFVFGASVLLHDSAMSLSAYKNGLDDLEKTIEWKDTIANLLNNEGYEFSTKLVDNPPEDIIKKAIPQVLRVLHATQAENLATQGWLSPDGEQIYLIEDTELRKFYGESIGKIAYSHWWPIAKVQDELSQDLGAFPGKTKSRLDRIKIACLLRLSDALHIDQRRAPIFLQTLQKPENVSALHWKFQSKIATPHIEQEEVVFTSAASFSKSESSSWWLAYDTISMINKEFIDVDLLLQSTNKNYFFRARKVKNANSPEALSKTLLTNGWRPIDTTLRISDIPKVIQNLGGSKLYGDNPTIALRELLQNSADSIEARRKYQHRPANWGEINVSISQKGDDFWLSVEDNGIGMSENVLTGPLIDFGTSFWKTPLAQSEFPGLASKGLMTTGRFGIGFFSVFMLADNVKVISKRFDKSNDDANVLEFSDGLASRPLISKAAIEEIPLDGGTRVEFLLKQNPFSEDGMLTESSIGQPFSDNQITLKQLINFIAPSISTSINVLEDEKITNIIKANDWLDIESKELISRINPSDTRSFKYYKNIRKLINENGEVLGRAAITPNSNFFQNPGKITVGGLYSRDLRNITGLLKGTALTASRDVSTPLVDATTLVSWANEQSSLIQASKLDSLTKMQCASVILECRGDIGNLPVIQQNDTWLNLTKFKKSIKNLSKIIFIDDNDLTFEPNDDVTVREFEQHLHLQDDIYVIHNYDARLQNTHGSSWTDVLFRDEGEVEYKDEDINRIFHREKKIKRLIMKCIIETWGEPNVNIDDGDFMEIAICNGTPIIRNPLVITR